MEGLTIKSIFSDSWTATKKNMLFLCGLTVVYFLVMMLLQGLNYLGKTSLVIQNSVLVANVILCGVMMWFIVGYTLRVVRQQPVEGRLEGSFGTFLINYIAGYLLLMLPIILLGVPFMFLGIYFVQSSLGEVGQLLFLSSLALIMMLATWYSVRMGMFGYILQDKKVNCWESFKLSFAITKGHFWKIFAIYLLCFLVMVVGMLLLIVGLFPAISYSFCILAELYDRLMHAYEAKHAVALVEEGDGE